MSCKRIKYGSSMAILSVADVYEFEGYTFEWHDYMGPVRLRKDGEPASPSYHTKDFYRAVERWQAQFND